MTRMVHEYAVVAPTAQIDETAYVPADVEIGHGCIIGPNVVFAPGVLLENYCIIDEGVVFEGPCRVWNWVHIRAHAVIGVNVMIGDLVHIGPGCHIGHNVRIGNGAQIHHPACIEENAWVGPNVFLSNDRYPDPGAEFSPQPVHIEREAIVGACAQIVGGVTVHAGAAVGIGATVTRDIESGNVSYGCPARPHREREVHYPGTAWEHWGPLDPTAPCHICKMYGAVEFKAVEGGEACQPATSG
jgi:UDP-3-O-[3-hydroxymyristoyl] glucosamine N-acyltransferase